MLTIATEGVRTKTCRRAGEEGRQLSPQRASTLEGVGNPRVRVERERREADAKVICWRSPGQQRGTAPSGVSGAASQGLYLRDPWALAFSDIFPPF